MAICYLPKLNRDTEWKFNNPDAVLVINENTTVLSLEIHAKKIHITAGVVLTVQSAVFRAHQEFSNKGSIVARRLSFEIPQGGEGIGDTSSLDPENQGELAITYRFLEKVEEEKQDRAAAKAAKAASPLLNGKKKK